MSDPDILAGLRGQGAEPEAARHLAARLEVVLELPAAAAWAEISHEPQLARQPFAVHRYLYDLIFASWDWCQGPPPAWSPPDGSVAATNIHTLMQDVGVASYGALHAWSVTHREAFWERLIQRLEIRFDTPFSAIQDQGSDHETPDWLPGARLNITDTCLAGPSDAPAVVHDDEDGALTRWTYGQLRSLTNRVVASLGRLGLEPGDAIAVPMPMTPESVAIFLGIVRAGCVAVSVSDALAPAEIGTRLRLGGARVAFCYDYLGRGARRLPLYEKLVAADAPQTVVLPWSGQVAMPLRPGDVAWSDFLVQEEAQAAIPRRAGDRTSILFSSGTTGTPKAIPWTHTTPIKCAADGWLHHDIQPRDVVAWPTSLGWMMGPWLIYATLINGATMALSRHAPNGAAFGRFVQRAGVHVLGVVPSLVKAWRNTGCMEGLDWSRIKLFSSTGECSNADDMLYLMSLAGYKPVIEYCGGTEIGGAYITGTVVQPASPATFSTPALGLDVHIADDSGRPADRGELFVVPPSIGLSTELIGADHHQVYFHEAPLGPGGALLRRHGDEMERLGGGYYRAHGRVDDTMNLHGIKVSAAEIERVVAGIELVHEAAAIAVPPAAGGPDQLVLYVVLSEGSEASPRQLKAACQLAIRSGLGGSFRVDAVVPVEALPRTASNKVMRRTLRQARQEGSARQVRQRPQQGQEKME